MNKKCSMVYLTIGSINIKEVIDFMFFLVYLLLFFNQDKLTQNILSNISKILTKYQCQDLSVVGIYDVWPSGKVPSLGGVIWRFESFYSGFNISNKVINI